MKPNDAPLSHSFDIAREVCIETEKSLRRMGLTEAEIAIRGEPARSWTRTEHPGPGMRRVLLQWPQGDVQETSVQVDATWEWSTAKVIAFRCE